MVNRALAACSLGSISAFEEDSDLAGQAAMLWPEAKESVLGAAPWSCTIKVVQLARLAVTQKPARRAYEFPLPADALSAPRTVRAEQNGLPFQDYDVFGTSIFADVEAIWIEYQADIPPIMMPVYLRDVLSGAARAIFARSICANASLADKFDYETYGSPQELRMGGLMGKALLLEAQLKPARPFDGGRGGPFLNAFNAGYGAYDDDDD
ncbi:MAG: hypothetical protein RLZZ157_1875 [Pseudomonadota bacterium]|jgi:hypothetical protein